MSTHLSLQFSPRLTTILLYHNNYVVNHCVVAYLFSIFER